VFERVEFAGYLIGFWLFIFSENFRGKIIKEYKEGSFLKRGMIVFEGISSTFVSVILPAILIYYAITD
jgi:hypothetical protein